MLETTASFTFVGAYKAPLKKKVKEKKIYSFKVVFDGDNDSDNDGTDGH